MGARARISRIRRDPYTVRGIRWTLCYRCKKGTGYANWYICSLGGYGAMCAECDIDMQRIVLEWANVPAADREKIIERYRRKVVANLEAGRVSEE